MQLKQNFEQKQCNFIKHENKQINYICLNEDCQQCRLGCLQCIQESHHDHPTSIYSFEAFRALLYQLKKENCKYIEKIEQIIMKIFNKLLNIRQQIIEHNKILSTSSQEFQSKEFEITAQLVNKYNTDNQKLLFKSIDEEIKKIEIINFNYYINQLNQQEINNNNPIKQQQIEDQKIQVNQINDQYSQESIQDIEKKLHQHQESEHFLQAYFEVQKLLQRFPNNSKYLYKLAFIYSELKEYDLSNSTLDQIIKIEPNNMEAFAQKMYMMRSRNSNEVLNLIDEKMANYPDNFHLIQCKGVCLHDMRRYQEAIPFLFYINEIQAKPNIKYLLARCYERLGQNHQAIIYYIEAQQMGHFNYKQIEKSIQKLKGLISNNKQQVTNKNQIIKQ